MIALRTKVGGKKFNALVVRLKRRGRIHDPMYDIVVMRQDSRGAGSYIEKLGYFNPRNTERGLILNSQRMAYWVKQGVRVHPTVKRLIVKFLV